MGKYETDNYSVTLFDVRGRKLLKEPLGNVGLMKALDWARERVQAGEAHSYVVERVLANSMDDRAPWSPTRRCGDGKECEGR